jgi:hypothetical protein
LQKKKKKKKNNLNNNKFVENDPKTPQKVPFKMTLEPSDKRDLAVKIFSNVDKIIPRTMTKN